MAESGAPLVPRALWPRVHDLLLALLALGAEERSALLEAESDPEVARWVRTFLEEEPLALEPPDLADLLPRLRVGSTVGGRYQLLDPIGSGGFGDVYRAEDPYGDAPVAVKVIPLSPDDPMEPHEWAALRVLDIPGVVPLLDAQEHEGELALVLPYIDGTPFPGADVGSGEEADVGLLEERLIALLEILERLHAAGYVHGDLKPGNVLVDEQGLPVVLDLGVARRWRRQSPLSTPIACTPRYAAPELLRGARPMPRSDLHSVGAMLDEILAGKPDVGARIPEEPGPRTVGRTPLRKLRPDLPGRIVHLVDALVTEEGRPNSASEALDLLGRGCLEDRLRDHLAPWPAPEVVEEKASLLAAGESIEFTGDHRSGRSELLSSLAEMLGEWGETVLLLDADRESWIEALVSREERSALASWPRLRTILCERVRRMHDEGAIILVDDADLLEDERLADTIDVLFEDGRTAVTVQHPHEPSEELAQGDAEALRTYFEGPDAILHLREDAARELFVRTDGLRGAIVEELAAWVRAGWARFGSGGRMRVDREAIQSMRASSPLPLRSLPDPGELSEEEERCLAHVQLAAGEATRAFVDHVDRAVSFDLDATVDGLIERGVLAEEDGRLRARARIALGSVLTEVEQARARERLAAEIAPHDPRRLRLLVRAGATETLASEALVVGRGAMERGDPDAAFGALLVGLRRLDTSERPESELLEELTEVSMQLQTRSAMQRSLHEIALSNAPLERRLPIYRLLTIAIRLGERDRTRTLREFEALDPPDDPRWRRRYAVLLAHAGRRFRDADLREEAVELLSELAETGDDVAARDLAEILGGDHYSRGLAFEAIVFHRRAVELSADPVRRCANLQSLGFSTLEAGEYEECEAVTEEAIALAVRHRYAHLEARGRLLESSLAYRRGDPCPLSAEVCAAAESLDLWPLVAHLHLNEAARLWRAGARQDCASHALRAVKLWGSGPGLPGALTSRALSVAAGAEITPEELRRRLVEIRDEPLPGAAAQAAALLLVSPVLAEQEVPRELQGWIDAFIDEIHEKIPPRLHALRKEVLSVAECLEILKGRRR